MNNACNGEIFDFDGSDAALYVIISLNATLLAFLMFKMCQLCSIAFSYSNFHIH